MHVFADGCQLGHADQGVQHPAVPSRQEAGECAPILVGEMAERAGNRLFNDHLAQLSHDHEGDEAANGVAEDHRGPGRLECARRAQKQPRADGASQCDQLDVSIFQAALQLT